MEDAVLEPQLLGRGALLARAQGAKVLRGPRDNVGPERHRDATRGPPTNRQVKVNDGVA